jgi:hypothetical protein
MDRMVIDEIARINAYDVQSDFEKDIRKTIIEWVFSSPPNRFSKTSVMEDAIEMFWNERLN